MKSINLRKSSASSISFRVSNLVPRARFSFGQHQEPPLDKGNEGSEDEIVESAVIHIWGIHLGGVSIIDFLSTTMSTIVW